MVTLNEVPAGVRTPFAFIEIDPSRAQQGPSVQTYRACLIGQKTSTGSLAQNTLRDVTSADEVAALAGSGSILHMMALAFFRANNVTQTTIIALDDAGGSTAGTQTLTVTGTATANGSLFLYISGRRIVVPVTNGDAAATVAASIDTALQASDLYAELPVTSGVVSAVVTLTAKNAGTQGNEIDVRQNFLDGEAAAAGISVAIAAGVSGATDPTLTAAVAAMGDVQFHTIAVGLNDTTSIGAIDTELADRFTASRQIEGHAFYGVIDTHANLVTFGSGLNSKHTTVDGVEDSPSQSWERASSIMGLVSRFGAADPGRPFTTLEMPGIVAPPEASRFTLAERDILLKNGIATTTVDVAGVVRAERLITTFQTNSSGVASTAFLDVNVLLTLSFLRFDMRTQFVSTFPRFKLAADGTRFGPGQAVVTPRVARAFFLTVFAGWETLGLVEDAEQFETDLIVQINVQDPNRLDVSLSPNLINQLRILGASISFIV